MSDKSTWRRTVRGAMPPRTVLLALAIAVPAVAAVAAVPVALGTAEYGEVAPMAALSLIPVLFVHRWPRIALAAATLAEAAHLILMDRPGELPPGVDLSIALVQPVPIATALTAGLAVLWLSRRDAWLAPLLAALTLAGVSMIRTGMEDIGTDILLFDLVIIGAALGWAARTARDRRVRRAAERAEHAERAVVEERLRIARDLHDVLAHQLTLINAKAGVAEYLLDSNPAAAREALSGIARHTATALDEVRATVGMMRLSAEESPDARQALPSVAQLPQLVESFSAAGTTASLEVIGEPRAVPDNLGLALYRITQEAFTNAAKHAPGARVTVEVEWWMASVRVRIENSAPARTVHGNGTGAGLIGMAERARALGGTVECGATASGGYAVVADLPCASIETAGAEVPR